MKMRNAVQTIGNLIDKQNVSFISSVDENGYPNTKAMLPPRKREGIKSILLYYKYVVSACKPVPEKPAGLYLFL